MTKIRSITKLENSTVFIYLLYEYSKRFVLPVVQPVVEPAAKCKRTLRPRGEASVSVRWTERWTDGQGTRTC